MANFARGLQAGLPVGLALGEGFRDRRERRAYQEAAQQWTPEETELNLGDAPISGGAPPMARGIGPQMSPEGMQEVETQRLTAPPGSMPRSQTQRRFSLPGAPGEMYGTEADASRAARVRGLEAQRQAAMQLGDIDAANRLAGSIHSMEQDEARTAMAQAGEDRAQTDFDQRQADRAALAEFTETTAGMSSEERLRAAGDISNHSVRSAVIDQVAAELNITSTQANIRLTNLQMSELEDEAQRNDAWGEFFAENADQLQNDPPSFLASARASGNPDFAARALELVRDDVSLEIGRAQLESTRNDLIHQQRVLDEEKTEWEEVARINEEYPDPDDNLQARLDSSVLAVRVGAYQEAQAKGELDALNINVAAQGLEIEAMQQTAAVNRAHRAFMEAGGTDVNVFFDNFSMDGEPVQVVEAQDDRGRRYYTVGRDTNGDGEIDNFLNFRGTSLDGLYADILAKFSSPDATLEQLTQDNQATARSLSNADLRQITNDASDPLQSEILSAITSSSFFVLPEGMQQQQINEQISPIALEGLIEQVRDDMLEGVRTGQWNSRVTGSSVAEYIMANNIGYDEESGSFFVRSPTNPDKRIPANIFREGSEAQQIAIQEWQKSEAEEEERFRVEAYRSLGDGGLSGPAAFREAEGEEESRGIQSRADQMYRDEYYPRPAEQNPGWGVSPELKEWWNRPVSSPERDMADGGLVKASGESAKGKWREHAAAGLRANQRAQRSMEGEVAPSAPLAYQPLNDMSAMERMQRSRVQAPVNMADGGLARKDMRGGGDVSGPGTETSDSIPARLSDGEYVLNAETVKLVGEDYLDKINKEGLRRRDSRKRK